MIRKRLHQAWTLAGLAWAVIQDLRDGSQDDAMPHQPADPSHPSTLCRCDDGRPFPESITDQVDHLGDCEWRRVWCQGCEGTGYCERCSGDGVEPELGTTTAAEDWRTEDCWRTVYEMLDAELGHFRAENARLQGQVETLTGADVPGAAFADGVTVESMMGFVLRVAGEVPGVWTADTNPYGHAEVRVRWPLRSILTGPSSEVTEYVAAFHPQRVVAMLLEIKRLTLRDDLSTEKIASLEDECRAYVTKLGDARRDEVEVVKERDLAWDVINDAWKATGVGRSVRGMATLSAVVATHREELSALLDQIDHAGCTVARCGERTYECPADATCGLCRMRNERDTARAAITEVAAVLDPEGTMGTNNLVRVAMEMISDRDAFGGKLVEARAELAGVQAEMLRRCESWERIAAGEQQRGDAAEARVRLDAADKQAMKHALTAMVEIRDLVRVDGYERPLAGRAVEIISNLLADDGGRGPVAPRRVVGLPDLIGGGGQ